MRRIIRLFATRAIIELNRHLVVDALFVGKRTSTPIFIIKEHRVLWSQDISSSVQRMTNQDCEVNGVANRLRLFSQDYPLNDPQLDEQRPDDALCDHDRQGCHEPDHYRLQDDHPVHSRTVSSDMDGETPAAELRAPLLSVWNH